MNPVSFAMDWDAFRDQLSDSLGRTGYGRYVDWFGFFGAMPKRKTPDDDDDDSDVQSVRLKKPRVS
jgi:hypothetical protein